MDQVKRRATCRKAKYAYYRRNKAACVADAKRRRTARRELIRALKVDAGCFRCGYARCADALQFHHRDPATKSFQVSEVTRGSLATVQAEINKCDILCANCHFEVEAVRT